MAGRFGTVISGLSLLLFFVAIGLGVGAQANGILAGFTPWWFGPGLGFLAGLVILMVGRGIGYIVGGE